MKKRTKTILLGILALAMALMGIFIPIFSSFWWWAAVATSVISAIAQLLLFLREQKLTKRKKRWEEHIRKVEKLQTRIEDFRG